MGDRCPYLKHVLDCVKHRKFGDFSHVDAAKRELATVFQAQPSIPAIVQREFIKFLDVIDSGSPQEIVKYRSQHDTSSYDQIIKQYEDLLEKKSNGAQNVSKKSSANHSNPRQSEQQPKPNTTSESNRMNMKDLQINELQTRLSKVAGERLRDNNPNITDLSDVNRPTKLAEMFKEMYDNEWTSAYEALQKSGIRNEEEIVKKLCKILKLAFDFCLRQAREHRSKIREALVYPAGVHATINANVEPNIDKILSPKVRQIQRETGVHAVPAIQELFRIQHESEIKRNELDESKEISQYIMNCVRICWLFAIQDPPMKLHWPKEETAMDEHVVAYTKSGTRIKFVVWPTLYLHDKGPVMTKGVVQPF